MCDSKKETPSKRSAFIKKSDIPSTSRDWFLSKRVKRGEYGDLKGKELVEKCAGIYCDDCGQTMVPVSVVPNNTYFYFWNVTFSCKCENVESCVVDARQLSKWFDPIYNEQFNF